MEGRRIVLAGTFALIALLAVLTVALMVQDGVNARTVVSLLLLAVLGIGVFGALNQPPDE